MTINITGSWSTNHFVERDKKKRSSFLKAELRRIILKSVSLDCHLPFVVRWGASIELHGLNGPLAKVHNRCILTGRPKSINRSFRLSRFAFRKLASLGFLPGVSKSSW